MLHKYRARKLHSKLFLRKNEESVKKKAKKHYLRTFQAVFPNKHTGNRRDKFHQQKESDYTLLADNVPEYPSERMKKT